MPKFVAAGNQGKDSWILFVSQYSCMEGRWEGGGMGGLTKAHQYDIVLMKFITSKYP